MKRNAEWVGHIKRTWRYTAEQWRDSETRRQAFIEARKQAIETMGEIILRVQDGRRSYKVASIRCHRDSRGRSVFVRHHPGRELLDKPRVPDD